MREGVLAYILRANKESPVYLCVMDDAEGKFHKFEISPLVASRLAAECAGVVNDHLGQYKSQLVK